MRVSFQQLYFNNIAGRKLDKNPGNFAQEIIGEHAMQPALQNLLGKHPKVAGSIAFLSGICFLRSSLI
jgi:predicted metalloprotease